MARKIRDYISDNCSADREHFGTDKYSAPIYKAFGEPLWKLMEELNRRLAASRFWKSSSC